MVFIFSSTAMYLTIAVSSLFLIYYLYLAIRLYSHGEWQWFCLPFIALLAFLVIEGLRRIMMLFSSVYNVASLSILYSIALIIVSLLSGFAVYWLMNKYRQQTIFIHFYAFFYFLYAFELMGFLFSRFLDVHMFRITKYINLSDFFYSMAIIVPFYGIFVLILGVFILDYRLRELKAEDKG